MRKQQPDYGEYLIGEGVDLSRLELVLKGFYKIVLLSKGSKIRIDFEEYACEQDGIFFFNEEQFFELGAPAKGRLVFFHPDFYCIELHDHELACDGILFSNVFSTPYMALDKAQVDKIDNVVDEISRELKQPDRWTEEKVRILVKYIIIESTRTWLKQRKSGELELSEQDEFSRKFSQLVEKNYTRLHYVGEYAKLMGVTTKTLNKRITTDTGITPSCIIVNRIMLQAKRLLVYTQLTVKEIAHKLGYDDAAYFSRYFKVQTQVAPLTFRKNYLSS